MKKFLLLLFILLVIIILIYGIKMMRNDEKKTSPTSTTPPVTISLDNIVPSRLEHLEIPGTSSEEMIVKHTAYTLLYNERHEQASWVAYTLTSRRTQRAAERSNTFVPDPAVSTGTATNSDYSKSGYDKGHLAPAADMSWSQITMKESFFLSNMSPQLPGFNRGIWKRLEEQVRLWAVENDSLCIVTGPVLEEGLPVIGANKVSIPKYYYKVVLDYKKPGIKGIGFILPNAASVKQLIKYAVTIDSVEVFTGIDFYSQLPDDQEKIIEKSLCIPCWTWGKGN